MPALNTQGIFSSLNHLNAMLIYKQLCIPVWNDFLQLYITMATIKASVSFYYQEMLDYVF